MLNKKVLIDSLKKLGSAKAPTQKKDIIVGSNNPAQMLSMKKGGSSVDKKLSVKKSNIQGKGLFIDQPIRKGEIIGLAHLNNQATPVVGKYHNHSEDSPTAVNISKGNKRYLVAARDLPAGTEITTNYRLQPELEQPEDFMRKGGMTPQKDGYRTYSPFKNLPFIDIETDTIDTDNIVYDLQLRANNGVIKNVQKNTGLHKIPGATVIREIPMGRKGGSAPKLPKKKNSRGYSRSLEATNKFFTENRFFAKPKSRKNKVYDPNAKYYQDGGFKEEDKLKQRLLNRYPGFKKALGTEGENLHIIADPNFKASEHGYGDIEVMFPNVDQIEYTSDYTYKSPFPGDYVIPYNPNSSVNKGDIFLDMLHLLRNDEGVQPYYEMFKTAALDRRGEDLMWDWDEEKQNPDFLNALESSGKDAFRQFENNYIDGLLRSELTRKGMGRRTTDKGYKLERRASSPEMRKAANEIYKYLKTKEKGGFTIELSEDEIQEYAKGGYIIEDISVPQLTQAQRGGDLIKTQFGQTVSLTDQNEYNKRLQYYNLSKNLQDYINTNESHIPENYRRWVNENDVLKGDKLYYDGWYPDIHTQGTSKAMNKSGYIDMEDYRILGSNFYYDIKPDAWYHTGYMKGDSLTHKGFGVPGLFPYWFKPVLLGIIQDKPEVGKLETKKLTQTPEIIPSNYNYTPQEPETIRTASRSQTVMEPDPNRPGKFRYKELRQVPYSAYFPEEGWLPMNAPQVMYYNPTTEEETEERFQRGGLTKAQTGRNVRYTDDPNDPGIKAYNDSLYSWNRGSQLLLSDPNISTAKEKVADGIFHPLDPLGPGSPSIEQYRKVLLPDSNSLTFKKPVQPVSFQSEPEIGKLLTKKLPQVQTPEIIPSNYNYTPKKPETIRTASRSQTIMEPDPNRPGKFKVKDIRSVPYSANFPGEGWEEMNAPRVMYYNPTTEEETEERFQRGGLIQAQNGLTIADPKEYAYRKGMYDDSLSLYNAYQFQKANYKPGYDAWLTDVGKDFTGGKEALKKAREKNLGKPLQKSYYTKTHKKSGYNNPSGDKNFDPLYPQEKFIIDKYKSIVKGNPNFRIGMHNSPDLWHKKIMPSGSYYAGAMNPIYKKPVQAIYKPGEEPTSDLESTNKESISLKTKPLQKINIESNLQNEVIPSTYSKPKKYNPTKTAYRSQTIMEQDPNRPGEYRMKESRQVPYATTKMYRKGDVWEDEYAPRVLWIDDEGNEVDVDPRKNNVAESSSFRKGGYIDAELTPEEIDWYRSQGYQIEDMD
jgi:hypothetical protein